MIERTPNLEAARAAASSALADSELGETLGASAPGSVSSPGGTAAPGATSRAADGAGSAAAAKAIGASREQLIKMGAMLVLGLSTGAAQRWGAHWVYTEQECLAVSEATLDVAEYYFGGFDHPLLNLGIVLGATALPRVLGPKLPPLTAAALPASSSAAPGAGQPASSSSGQPAATSPAPEAKAA